MGHFAVLGSVYGRGDSNARAILEHPVIFLVRDAVAHLLLDFLLTKIRQKILSPPKKVFGVFGVFLPYLACGGVSLFCRGPSFSQLSLLHEECPDKILQRNHKMGSHPCRAWTTEVECQTPARRASRNFRGLALWKF